MGFLHCTIHVCTFVHVCIFTCGCGTLDLLSCYPQVGASTIICTKVVLTIIAVHTCTYMYQ